MKTARLPPITEDQFQKQIIQLAKMCGWRVAHFRSVPIRSKNGSVYYATPVQADGEGFPDLVLVHAKRRMLAFIEVKRSLKENLSSEQRAWLEDLFAASEYDRIYRWVTDIWRPEEWPEIEKFLKG